MNICFTTDFNIDIKSSNLKDILKTFVKLITPLFEMFASQVILSFAEYYMKNGVLAFAMGCKRVTWKSLNGSARSKISTPLGVISIPQIQIKNSETGQRRVISRILLGIDRGIRIPEITKLYFGLMGALAPLRVVNKFLSLFSGFKVSLMTLVRSIRATGKKIIFDVDSKGLNEFEADGTGLPIKNAGKRGKELKILAQRKKKGGIRIAGMTIGNYKKGWGKLFAPLKSALENFDSIFLVTDGDASPLAGLKGITVIIQRCLFHIAHEIKYTLWQDKVKRKNKTWRYILAKTLEITNVKRVYEEPGVLKNVVKWKRNLLTRLIKYCKKKRLKFTTPYLENAKQDIFTGIERRITGGTTSLIERVMRTVNQRINIAQWSDESAQAVAKIRGAYYYNGFDV
jgi:hypothetical protein